MYNRNIIQNQCPTGTLCPTPSTITCKPSSETSKWAELPSIATADQPGRVYINKTQYIEGVLADVWEFYIDGYPVCHKWLKDRKGRQLTYNA